MIARYVAYLISEIIMRTTSTDVGNLSMDHTRPRL